DDRLEPLLAVLAERGPHQLVPELRHGVRRRDRAPEAARQELQPIGYRRGRIETAARGERVHARQPIAEPLDPEVAGERVHQLGELRRRQLGHRRASWPVARTLSTARAPW